MIKHKQNITTRNNLKHMELLKKKTVKLYKSNTEIVDHIYIEKVLNKKQTNKVL